MNIWEAIVMIQRENGGIKRIREKREKQIPDIFENQELTGFVIICEMLEKGISLPNRTKRAYFMSPLGVYQFAFLFFFKETLKI